MKLVKYIANLGYGSRRDVMRMLADRRITRRNGTILGEGDIVVHEDVLIDGEVLDPAPGSALMLNKPVGYACSTKDANRLIYELLPARFADRSPIIAAIGRLDRDSSGLLLLTDDGRLNHRVTSPRSHLPKTYEVRLAIDLRGDEGLAFAGGALMLAGETAALQPATLEVLGPRRARVTVIEGRYHQVRRMFAAVGNHVDALHRSAIGRLTLDDLPSGHWRVLTAVELSVLWSPKAP